MQKYIQQIKSWYEKQKLTKSNYEKKGLSPTRDWLVMLTFSQFLVIVLMILCYYFYTQIDAGKLFKVEKSNKENEIKINDVLLKKTVGDINQREKDNSYLSNRGAIPTDPSF